MGCVGRRELAEANRIRELTGMRSAEMLGIRTTATAAASVLSLDVFLLKTK